MPLSEIQCQVLGCIAANRSPDSYVAGATVLHRAADSARYSRDLGFFHDAAECVAQCARQDAASLSESGFELTWLLQTPAFHRAVVRTGSGSLKLEWTQDSVFRFFPVVADPDCGFRLHDVDAATNKILALAGRDEVRDFVAG